MAQLAHVLVTGGAGFIGSHLADRLAECYQSITILDNFDPYYDPEQKRRNIADVLLRPNVSLKIGDIRDAAFVEDVLRERQIDGIVHLAARAGVRASLLDPLLYSSVNIDGTITLLEAARRLKVKTFIFGSSSSVYGQDTPVPFRESAPCGQPASPYAATKRAAELLCYTYWDLYKLPIVVLRFFTVYGPRQRPEMAIHRFFSMILRREKIPVYGHGVLLRDFTYVDDIVRGIESALRLDQPGYDVFNLGTTHQITVNLLIQKIEQVTGISAQKEYLAQQPGDMESTWADISRAQKFLNYAPQVQIDDGLHRFWHWFQQEQARQR